MRFFALDPGDMRTTMHFAAVPAADPAALRDPADVAREMLRFLAADRAGVRFGAKEWRNA